MEALTRWQTIDRLFDEVLQRPVDERTAWLRARCGDDSELYAAVEHLLALDTAAEVSIGESVSDFVAPLLTDLHVHLKSVSDLPPGVRIGPYCIESLLGRGGMGNVYLARRDDGTFTKQVALKLIRRGLDTDDILDRFRRERQMLALLDHPHIARVLDAGATEDGRPYLVMEYVQGRAITAHCDEDRLSIDERLSLFDQVCEAVRHAHARLVIHRDLKPSNVMVNDEGEVKLLDFGIARVLDQTDEGEVPATRAGSRLLTPQYAAPEHIRGETVSTTADVFSLGVLLYELLAGARPERRPTGEGPDIIARPSQAVDAEAAHRRSSSPEALRRRLRGDLDQIVLKAIAEEPDHRYPSVEALREDLRRHRTGLPVRARPPSRAYRASRFVRRHRAGVGIAGATAVLLIAGFIGLALAHQTATRERDRAESELANKQQVAAFLTDIFAASSPTEARGDTLTAFDLLRRGAERIRRDLEGQPEMQGQLLHVMSDVYERLGDLGLALDLAKEALAKRREVHGPQHLATAESLNRLGSILQSRGDFEAAHEAFTDAVTIRRALLGTEHQLYAESILNLGLNFSYSGDYEAAEPLVREALRIDRKLHGDRHPDIATALNNLAVLLYFKGAYAGAEEALVEALDIRREIYGDPHPRVAVTLNNLGSIQRRQGRLAEAEESLAAALSMQRRLVGDRHPDVASGLSNLAAVLSEQGDHARAEVLLLEALQIGRSVHGSHPEVADALANLGRTYLETNRDQEAFQTLSEALEMNTRTRGEEHPRTALAIAYVATSLERLGRIEEAETLYRKALSIQERVLPPTHDEVATTAAALGRLLLTRNQTAEAELLLAKARDAFHTTYGETDARTADLAATLAAARATTH